MLPLSLNPVRLRVALIGAGEAAACRRAWLGRGGVLAPAMFTKAPWPDAAALAGIQLVFIAGLEEPALSAVAASARAAGAILHVEDAPRLSDIHAPAVLRRGDLTIAISTNGAAPGLAAELARALGDRFGPEWEGRLAEIKALREIWRRADLAPASVRRLTAAQLARYGWPVLDGVSSANDNGKPIIDRGGGSCL